MALTLNLPPDVEARIAAEAERTGVCVEDIVVHLFNGYFWCGDSELEQEWHRYAGERATVVWLRSIGNIRQRERAVKAFTHENNLNAHIQHEERTIARHAREAVLAAQKEEREAALKAFQRKTLHEQKLADFKTRYVTAKDEAENIREELRRWEQSLHITWIELLRMKINRSRARLHLGMSAAERAMLEGEDAQIRKFASDTEWNSLYEQWIAAHQDTVPDEVPSEMDALKEINAKNQQQIEKHLTRIQELHDKMKPSGIENKTD